MKKLVLMFAVVAAMTFAACGQKAEEAPAVEEAVEVVEEEVAEEADTLAAEGEEVAEEAAEEVAAE